MNFPDYKVLPIIDLVTYMVEKEVAIYTVYEYFITP